MKFAVARPNNAALREPTPTFLYFLADLLCGIPRCRGVMINIRKLIEMKRIFQSPSIFHRIRWRPGRATMNIDAPSALQRKCRDRWHMLLWSRNVCWQFIALLNRVFSFFHEVIPSLRAGSSELALKMGPYSIRISFIFSFSDSFPVF